MSAASQAAVRISPRTLQVGTGWCRTLTVTGYPREVGPGWLLPLLTHPARLDVSLYVEPIPATVAAERLRRQLARLQATQHLNADRGKLQDFDVEAASDDAAELARQLARGEGRLFRIGLALTVHADTEAELDEQTGRVRALLASLLLDAHPTTYRTLQGWLATQPLALDRLRQHRTFDTRALATAFPFATGELPGTGGVLYGQTTGSRSLVFWDRFAQVNHNSVILAHSGAGKSYLAKLELLRNLYRGVQVAVIDPEDEYHRLADAAGGTTLRLGARGVRLNPFDLHRGDGGEALTRRGLFIHTLAAVLLGQELDPAAAAALDRGIQAVYQAHGIADGPDAHSRPAPLLRDLVHALQQDEDPAARTLAARLTPYTTGTHRHLFDGPTTTYPDGHLVVFSLRDLPEELTAVGTLLTLDSICRQVSNPAGPAWSVQPRMVVVDEAWLLMRHPAGAKFLYRLAKSARKDWTGLTVITQDAADLLGSDLGQAVVANASTHILLGQSPQAIDALTAAFHLSQPERGLLLAARPGEGLLAAGTNRVAFRTQASPTEHALVTTDPGFREPTGQPGLPRPQSLERLGSSGTRRRRRRRPQHPNPNRTTGQTSRRENS